MIQRLFVAIVVGLFGLVFASLAVSYTEQHALRPLAESYVKLVPHELGAPNVITGILLTYRGFDTLGEVAVLFMVAASVGLVLGTRRAGRKTSTTDRRSETRPSSEIVRTGAEILVPLICIFAAYIIMNGHLSAGGGFQGGAVIASGVLLTLLAFPQYQPNLEFLSITESARRRALRACRNRGAYLWPVAFSTTACFRLGSLVRSSAPAPSLCYPYCSASRSAAN